MHLKVSVKKKRKENANLLALERLDAILALFSLSRELREVDCFGILLESLFCALLGLVVTSPSSFIVGGDTLSFVPKLEVTTYAFALCWNKIKSLKQKEYMSLLGNMFKDLYGPFLKTLYGFR